MARYRNRAKRYGDMTMADFERPHPGPRWADPQWAEDPPDDGPKMRSLSAAVLDENEDEWPDPAPPEAYESDEEDPF
jgi:hypothetical protein